MSYKFSFVDNEIYSASDVNAITKRLVTSGIEDSFTDGVAYNVSKFNEAGRLLYTSGVVPETCLTLKVVEAEEGSILINPGMAFFDDGSVIEIEDGGEKLPYVKGAKNYVYLKNDLINANISYPYCGVAEPTGDCVLLAEISENGVITDKRIFARGKLPGYQSVGGNIMFFSENITLTNTSMNKQSYISGSATFDIGENNFKYILAMRTGERSYENMDFLGLYNIEEDTYIGFRNVGDAQGEYSSEGLCVFSRSMNPSASRSVTLSLKDGVLTVNLTAYDVGNFESGKQYTFPINLILF